MSSKFMLPCFALGVRFRSKRRFLPVVVFLGISLQVSPMWAGDLILTGKLSRFSTTVTLLDYSSKRKGDVSWELSKCVAAKDGNGLTEDDYHGVLLTWERVGNEIKITGPKEKGKKQPLTFSLTSSSSDTSDILNWVGQNATIDGISGTFEGKSSTKIDTALELRRSCDDSTENPGVVAILVKGSLVAAKKYLRAQGWEIDGGGATSAPSSAKNAITIDVPVGSELDIIEKIKSYEIVIDVGRDYLHKSVPQLGWILLPRDRMSGPSIGDVQSELQVLLDGTFANDYQVIRAAPKMGNVFEVAIRGPLSKFVEAPKLPGYWIDTKMSVMVDRVETGNRLLVQIREALLIRWPESGKGSPPKGAGTKLECENEGQTKDMTAAIAIAEKLMNKAS